MTARVRSAVVAATAIVLTACGAQGGSPSDGAPAPITVFAAASLQGPFVEIGEIVERRTGADVRLTYAGSADLAAQLAAGAPGDVFASADADRMDTAVAAGAVQDGQARPFATNTLTVVTPPDDPGKVSDVTDLTRSGLRVVLCAPQVPCGAATRELFRRSGVAVTPVSEEGSVTDVLGKVRSGQADAGLVYVTDAARAGDAVRAVPTPEARGIVNVYPIAVTAAAQADPARSSAAQAFVDTVLSPEGRAILQKAGFGVPPDAR